MMYFKYPFFTKFMFFKLPGKMGDAFKFSSDLEKIGTEWDVSIQNGTLVDVISEPIKINRPQYGGMISVIKIKADIAVDYHTIIKECWVPINCITELKENETSSTQFRN